jgi:hypothetical protein
VASKYYEIIWKFKISFKVQIFKWSIKKTVFWPRLILSKEDGRVIHTVYFVNYLWQWLAANNNFTFVDVTLDDFWILDASIPFKHVQLIEMIRGAMWTIWLERNWLYLNADNTLKSPGYMHEILSSVHYGVKTFMTHYCLLSNTYYQMMCKVSICRLEVWEWIRWR